jgi:hypothetical protein
MSNLRDMAISPADEAECPVYARRAALD